MHLIKTNHYNWPVNNNSQMKKNNSSVNLQFPHHEQEVYDCTFYRSLLYLLYCALAARSNAACERASEVCVCAGSAFIYVPR